MEQDNKSKVISSLQCAYYGEALSMPVHWYYNLDNIKKDYGGDITGLTTPVDIQSGGFLNKIKDLGDDSNGGTVVGNVINHGKAEIWTREPCHHYHFGLKAGENTHDV